MLQAKINDLQNTLSRAYIVDKSNLSTERAAFGLKVRVLDVDFNEEEDYILVGPGEEDPDQDKIPITGPVGQSLVGKQVGEQVEVPVPRGRPHVEDPRDQPALSPGGAWTGLERHSRASHSGGPPSTPQECHSGGMGAIEGHRGLKDRVPDLKRPGMQRDGVRRTERRG